MQIFHLDTTNPITLPPHALTIGNFDGVHLGHKAMLQTLKNDANAKQLGTAIMIFEPQPQEFFNPANPPARLTNLAEKSAILAELGMDYLLIARFDDEFRSLSAKDFADILTKLGSRHLVLGDDFRFGHDRKGDKHFLKTLGFSIDDLPTISMNNHRISSTAIREVLAVGDLAFAEKLLGRAYTITGEVIHGDKIGRTLNFPTANIALNRPKPALNGIFGADVFIYKDGKPAHLTQFSKQGIAGKATGSLFGCVNIGTRPTVNGVDYRLEVHLPEFDGDLYGMQVKVVFRKFLHGERHYDNLTELKNGIARDVKDLIAWHKESLT